MKFYLLKDDKYITNNIRPTIDKIIFPINFAAPFTT